MPFCPLPAPHPDPSRQTALLEHLQSLFLNLVVLTNAAGAALTSSLVPSLKCLVLEHISLTTPSDASGAHTHRAKPSDAVAFMLTSGSTGKPKAVVLRHSNFLSSCAGKSKHHGTSSTTAFLNWIAFDHVASLSEIHIHAMLVDAPYVYHGLITHIRSNTILGNTTSLQLPLSASLVASSNSAANTTSATPSARTSS